MAAVPESPHSRFLSVTGFILTGTLVALSAWAVASVQLSSGEAGDPVRYWYLAFFLLAEFWVAAGLVMTVRAARRRAPVAALCGLLVWAPAVVLSAQQEWRFHTLRDARIGDAYLENTSRLSDARVREAELVRRISELEPVPPLAAIEAEIARYAPQPQVYPTRLAELRANAAIARERHRLDAELSAVRARVESLPVTGEAAARAQQVASGLAIPVLGLRIEGDVWIWSLIAWAMLVKALGPVLLFGATVPRVSPGRGNEVKNEVGTERWETRTDRHGNVRRVRVLA